MSLPHPRGKSPVFPVLSDEEEAAAIKAAMEGDWEEDQDLRGDPAFEDEDENMEADPEE